MPDLEIPSIKVKVDTGARTSTLHAIHVEEFQKQNKAWIRFRIHPFQQETQTVIESDAPLLEYRMIRSSNGQSTRRPVILTTVEMLGMQWQIELTLTNRDAMGFRMLLGREAIRGRFVVNPSESYLAGLGPQTEHDRHLARIRHQAS